jgi:hypothetical protein
MGFLDKVKQQAGTVTQKAQEGVKSGQAKLDAAQSKKKADALMRDLGAAVYAQRSGTAGPENDAEIERLIGEIRAIEAEQGPVETQPVAGTVPAPGEGAGTAAPQGGSYSLDDL